MSSLETIKANLLSPIVLAFLLGAFAKFVRSEIRIPKDLYSSLSLYLLLALGLKGGVELSHSEFSVILWPSIATLFLGCLTPLSAYLLCRRLGKFGRVDSAALAAHYGSVSAVTFIAATQFVAALGKPAEGYMATLLTLLESPGIHIALAIGVIKTNSSLREQGVEHTRSKKEILHEVLTGQSMILLVGGLVIGFLIGESGYEPVKPFFETGFKGALVLFLMEMGIVAASRFSELKRVGIRLISLGILIPIIHGFLGVYLGHLSGLSIGGSTVLGAMAASASYIAAPPAVRLTLPDANPSIYLTASLAITFPFNLFFGIPAFYEFAIFLN